MNQELKRYAKHKNTQHECFVKVINVFSAISQIIFQKLILLVSCVTVVNLDCNALLQIYKSNDCEN